jgi:hypothetical protein
MDDMNDVVRIGKCIGCNRSAQVDDGVCKVCLEHPLRGGRQVIANGHPVIIDGEPVTVGRKWAEMSDRIRNDLAFALTAFNEIGVRKPENELAGKLLFIRMYGVPVGAVLSPELKKLVDSSMEPDDPGSVTYRKEAPVLRLVR